MKIQPATTDRAPLLPSLQEHRAAAGITASQRRYRACAGRLIARQPALRALALGLVRHALKLDTTLRFGIPWYRDARDLARRDWDRRIEAATDPSVVIPSWFALPIHGILGGNDLTQAIEQPAAMSAMAALFGHEPGVRDVRAPHLAAFAPRLPPAPRILDVGCGAGDSLRALANRYPDATLTGIDLSPAMIAVGRYRNADRGFVFHHRAGEDNRFAEGAFDLVHECAVAHETPRFASIRRFSEAYRVLSPGGVFLLIDQDPASAVIQRQLRKNPLGHLIEPHIRSYCTLDVRAALERIGFAAVEKRKLHEDSTLVVWVGRKLC